MTVENLFIELKKRGRIEENLSYEKWLKDRIEEGLPVEGDLYEGYMKRGAKNMSQLEDFMSILGHDILTKPIKEETEAKEIQVRFIKKKE